MSKEAVSSRAAGPVARPGGAAGSPADGSGAQNQGLAGSRREEDANHLGRGEKISALLELYYAVQAAVARLPEKQLQESVRVLRELASRASREERVVNEIIALKQYRPGQSAQEIPADRGYRSFQIRLSASGLRRFVPRPQFPLFWEAAAFMLGLAIALMLT